MKEALETDNQAWFQKAFETDSLTDETEDNKENKYKSFEATIG